MTTTMAALVPDTTTTMAALMPDTWHLTLLDQMTFVFQQQFGLYILLSAIVFGFILSFAVSRCYITCA